MKGQKENKGEGNLLSDLWLIEMKKPLKTSKSWFRYIKQPSAKNIISRKKFRRVLFSARNDQATSASEGNQNSFWT